MANGFDTAEESYVGDDPTGIGYDEAGTSVASGVGYGSPNIDTGGNEKIRINKIFSKFSLTRSTVS